MALNSLAGCGECDAVRGHASAGQQHVARHVQRSVDMLGSPPEGLSCSEALRRLRVGSLYEPEVGAGCEYDRSLISWPERSSQPLSLAALLGEGGEEEIAEFIRLNVKDCPEARHTIHERRVPRAHWDARLRDPVEYGRLVCEMKERGLVTFRRCEEVTEELGIFVVPKKNGQLRLIADCRRSNEHFKSADHVWLATGETLATMELDDDELLHVAQGDLKNAFFQIALPSKLQHLFGMKKVRARDVGISTLADGSVVLPQTWVSPVLAIMPMGWKWALYWCQRMHELQLSLAGCTLERRLYDRSGRGLLGEEPAHLVYVDNYAVMGTNIDRVRSMAASVYKHLTGAGLLVHEVEGPSADVECLGWRIDGKAGTVSPTRKRVWKLKLVLKTVLQRGRLRGKDLERIVGHATFMLLVQRSSLSLLSAVYPFISKHYHVEQVLWPSVRRELGLLEALLPLLWVDMRRGWSEDVRMCDASPEGYGVVKATCREELVRQAGKTSERWRGALTSAAPREHFARWHAEHGWQIDLKTKPGAVRVDAQCAKSDAREQLQPAKSWDTHGVPFDEIPGEILRSKWKLCWKGLWKDSEAMPILEGRCALLAYKHLLRSTQNLGKKLLLLTDSITVASCLMKGRSSRGKMQGICRAFAALTLATNSSLLVRWLVSESNYADGPSRGLPWAATPSGHCPWHVVNHVMQEGAKCSGLSSPRGDGEEAPARRTQQSESEAKYTSRGSPSELEESQCDTSDFGKVSRDVGSISWSGKPSEAGQERIRPGIERRIGINVRGGSQYTSRSIHVCSSVVPQAGASKEVSELAASAERLEPGSKIRTEIADAMAISCVGSDALGEEEPCRGGLGADLGARPLPTPGRDPQATRLRSQSTIVTKYGNQRSLERGVTPEHKRRHVQNKTPRRSHGVRPSSSWRRVPFAQGPGESREHSTGEMQSKRGYARTEAQLGRARPQRVRAPTCLPSEARRRFLGCTRRAPDALVHPAERAVEFFQQSETLPEGCVREEGAWQHEGESEVAGTHPKYDGSKTCGALSPGGRRHQLLRRVLPAAQFSTRLRNCLRDPPVLLEIGGSENRLSGLATQHFLCLKWDIRLGQQYDLVQPRNAERLRCWIREGRIGALVMHVPLATFDSSYNYRVASNGKHGLEVPPLERHRMFRGTQIALALLSLARGASRHQLPWLLIGARSSQFFLMPAVCRLSETEGVRNEVVHSCHKKKIWALRVCGLFVFSVDTCGMSSQGWHVASASLCATSGGHSVNNGIAEYQFDWHSFLLGHWRTHKSSRYQSPFGSMPAVASQLTAVIWRAVRIGSLGTRSGTDPCHHIYARLVKSERLSMVCATHSNALAS
eukprot:6480919-Amphidinium_carterae.2